MASPASIGLCGAGALDVSSVVPYPLLAVSDLAAARSHMAFTLGLHTLAQRSLIEESARPEARADRSLPDTGLEPL
jgi:hypothetical protein